MGAFVNGASEPLWLLASGPRSALGIGFVEGTWGAIIKMVLPVVGYLALAPVLYLFFRSTWRDLDAEATDHRQTTRLQGRIDHRPAVLFALAAIILSAQEYYGGGAFFGAYLRPWLLQAQASGKAHGGWGQYVDVRFYGELYGYGWWALTRVLGYTVIPFAVWKLIFRRDSLLDMGFRTKGLLSHAWIYFACLAVVLPAVFIVAQSPDFARYYPFYKLSTRSWFDLLVWEVLYIAQFFALEVFFRGFMLVPLRKVLGAGAIFAMCVPYVMIHYGKPYLEASSAFLAGVALGSLAMKTRSIYSGFLVHVTVALLMDGLALANGSGLPTVFWPR
jgi:membrane protease YdiL (CAAX protease family)